MSAVVCSCVMLREDYGVCLDTHRNYAAGNYSTGPLSPRHEQGVAYFQNKVAEALNGA